MPNTNKHESPKPRIAEDGDHIVVNGFRIRRGEHLTYDVETDRIEIKS